MDELISKVEDYVKQFRAGFDASHDYSHIKRVVGLAKTLENVERVLHPTVEYRPHIITLASLLHDIGDHKYLKAGQDGKTMAEQLLLEFGAKAALASEIQLIVNHVSYSTEIKDLEKVREIITHHPELAIVQDANRLEALGAHGIGRCFGYNTVKNGSLYTAIEHFTEKLVLLEGMMKTATARQMAAHRTQAVKEFRQSWEDEELESEH